MVDNVNIRAASTFSKGLEIAGNTFTFVSRLDQDLTEMKCKAEIGSIRIESNPVELIVKRGNFSTALLILHTYLMYFVLEHHMA